MPRANYGGREEGLAEAIADQFEARGLGVSSGGGGSATAANQLTEIAELQNIKNRLPATGALSEGTDGTGTSIPNGGTGARGWLSAIWKIFSDRLMPAATETEYIGTSAGANLKASAGNIYAITVSNNNANTRYFQIFNKNSNPALNDVPVRVFPIPGSDSLLLIGQDVIGGNGILLSSGVTWGFSTSRLTYAAGAASDCIATVRWA